jgi:hypothetical protein
MAEITVSGRMKVKTLKTSFNDAFGATLRVYNGKRFADDDVTLASIRKENATVKGDLKVSGNMQIGNFEKKFEEIFGIAIQVADKENKKLLGDSITLAQASNQ